MHFKKQIYFSFVTAALSFITLKTIQDAGVHEYLILNPIDKSGKTVLFASPLDRQVLPFELNCISGAYFSEKGKLISFSTRTKAVYEFDLNTQSTCSLASITNTFEAEGFAGSPDAFYLVSEHSDVYTYTHDREPQKQMPSSFAKEATAYTYNPITKNLQVLSKHPEFINQWTITSNDAHYAHETIGEELVLTKDQFIDFQSSLENKNFPELSDNFTLDGIAHDPRTNDFFVLSLSDRLIAKCNGKGHIQALIYLQAKEYSRPLQLLIHPDGSLYLLNLVAAGTLEVSKLNYTHTN